VAGRAGYDPIINMIRVWLICFFYALGAAQSPSARNFEDLAATISKGDRASIYEAGESGDQRYVPVLRNTIQRFSGSEHAIDAAYVDKEKPRSLTSESVSGTARLALAKLGDKVEQQEVFCELHTANVDIQIYALAVKLNYVGGWFQVNALASLLENTGEYGDRRDESQVLEKLAGEQLAGLRSS
jgi:hypothetical protein